MPQKQFQAPQNDQKLYRMRKGLLRSQVIFFSIMALFSLGMMIALIIRREKSPLEYLFWLATIFAWCYASWYSFSARIMISAKDIEFRAAIARVYAEWSQIDHLGIEAAGPTLFMQDSNQVNNLFRKRKPKKIPLYLFMEKWKDKNEWEADPVGRDLIAYCPNLLDRHRGK